MSQHTAHIQWKNEGNDFSYKNYNRNHTWQFENGKIISASAAPDFLGDPEMVDPEEAFVASLASCHMLTFLAISSMKGFVITSYQDKACGILEKNDQKKMAITKVTLNPTVIFQEGKEPTEEELKKMHEKAHQGCFIANSVTTKIEVIPHA